ncbi:Aldo/keto reductase [Coniochaeta ligniaria NRRL 30616]|uniref:Aldo/keto reductase n=1 Tax=Coniochaeta ligniaria NRRL 30616 TaxID=1408157 RepID=A0A1J7JLN0_9PEZI|nr:Aldo/keto reductase [Coniochaeta ligniaria NRRL 30616]
MGTTSVHSAGPFATNDTIVPLLHTLLENGIKTIDTAQLYGNSEVVLGAAGVAALGFTLDTKVPGIFVPGSLEPGTLEAGLRRGLERLGIKSLDVFYLHAPNPKYPIAQTLGVLDRLQKEGLFARLGLSNFSVEEVREACDVAAEKGFVAPSVFQGNYSAIARRAEEELIPLLRERKIAFYAYSPLAGGFLAKRNSDELFGAETGGRFAKDGKNSFPFYQELYSDRPKLVGALETWASIAAGEGCECPAEMGYRWVAWNSALKAELGDKIVIGASRLEQVPQVVGWVKKGPLSEKAARAIDAMWEEVKDEAPMDNLHK